MTTFTQYQKSLEDQAEAMCVGALIKAGFLPQGATFADVEKWLEETGHLDGCDDCPAAKVCGL